VTHSPAHRARWLSGSLARRGAVTDDLSPIPAPERNIGDRPYSAVATEDSARDRRAPLARWRVPPVASGQPCRSARSRSRGQAGAPPAAWHALGPRRRITNGARLRRGALYPRLATVLARPARLCRRPVGHRRSPPADRTAARESRAGPTHCDGGKSHPPKAPRNRTSARVREVGKGTFFLVRAPGVRLGIRLQQVMPAIPPCAGTRSQPTDRHIVPLRCCILLLYRARERWAQDFEFIYLTWGGATEIRTPDLLHAISRQHVHPRLSPQVTVPASTRGSISVRVRCGTSLLYSPGLVPP
jgi:hypothetical protein